MRVCVCGRWGVLKALGLSGRAMGWMDGWDGMLAAEVRENEEEDEGMLLRCLHWEVKGFRS